jgi:hypothetical protein
MKKTIYIVYALLCSGCIETPTPTRTPVILIPQIVKDHCYFKKGTYWIYQCQQTGAIDSQWVVKNYNKIDTIMNDIHPDKIWGIFERFYCEIDASNDDYFRSYHIDTQFSKYKYLNNSPSPWFVVNRSKGGWGLNGGENYAFYYKFNVGTKFSGTASSTNVSITWLKELQDSVATPAGVFVQCPYFFIENSHIDTDAQLSDYQDVHLHYAQNIGLVKYRYEDEDLTWVLVRKNIVQ